MVGTRTGDATLASGPAGRVVAHGAWFTVLFLTPLSLPLGVLRGSVEALVDVSAFRAALVGVGLVVCTLAYLAVAPPRSKAGGDRARPPTWVLFLLGLVTWVLLSTAFSNVAPWPAVLGSLERTDGTLVVAGWLLLTLACFGLARHAPLREEAVLRWALAAALVTSAWTYLQALRLDPLTLLTGLFFTIPAGAFGHGALSGMFIAFVALVAATSWSIQDALRPWHFAVFGLLGIGLGASGGRAAMVGLLVGAVVLVAVNRRSRPAMRKLALFGAVVVLGLAISLVTTSRAQRQARALASAFVGADPSFNARPPAWRGGLRLLLENPLFGVGPEGFGFAVWDLLSPEDRAILIRSALGDRIDQRTLADGDYTISGNVIAYLSPEGNLALSNLKWDKAHNYLIDMGLTSGVPALLTFVGFVVFALTAMWRSSSMFARGVAIAMLAFLVFGLAWFPTVNLDPVVWSLTGAGIGFAARERTHLPGATGG